MKKQLLCCLMLDGVVWLGERYLSTYAGISIGSGGSFEAKPDGSPSAGIRRSSISRHLHFRRCACRLPPRYRYHHHQTAATLAATNHLQSELARYFINLIPGNGSSSPTSAFWADAFSILSDGGRRRTCTARWEISRNSEYYG